MGYLKNTINTQRAILIPIPSSGKAGAPIPDISTKFKFGLAVDGVSVMLYLYKCPLQMVITYITHLMKQV